MGFSLWRPSAVTWEGITTNGTLEARRSWNLERRISEFLRKGTGSWIFDKEDWVPVEFGMGAWVTWEWTNCVELSSAARVDVEWLEDACEFGLRINPAACSWSRCWSEPTIERRLFTVSCSCAIWSERLLDTLVNCSSCRAGVHFILGAFRFRTACWGTQSFPNRWHLLRISSVIRSYQSSKVLPATSVVVGRITSCLRFCTVAASFCDRCTVHVDHTRTSGVIVRSGISYEAVEDGVGLWSD